MSNTSQMQKRETPTESPMDDNVSFNQTRVSERGSFKAMDWLRQMRIHPGIQETTDTSDSGEKELF